MNRESKHIKYLRYIDAVLTRHRLIVICSTESLLNNFWPWDVLRTNLKFFGAAVIVTIPCSASVAAKLSVRQDTDLQCALHESSWWPPSPALESNSFILWIKPFNSVWSCPWMLRQLISLPGSASQINGCAHRQFVEWRS